MAAGTILRVQPAAEQSAGVQLRVRGRVQGVGFRPTVWRIASDLALHGDVRNDAEGVLVRLVGPRERLDRFEARLRAETPPLARIDVIERAAWPDAAAAGFHIVESVLGRPRTQVSPDARICEDCAREVQDPSERRYFYGLTNCTHCGPRLTILHQVPYDRGHTTMAPFALCEACLAEYRDPADRRFHAEPIACPICGPTIRCDPIDGEATQSGDPITRTAELVRRGAIVAIKALGGYQLACDATNAAAVARLRAAKHREAKPFALMARDLAVLGRYARIPPEAAELLAAPEAPIVLLEAAGEALPDAVAPGLSTLGFMLPTTPLHLLLMRDFATPVVMTSGNRSDEPQATADAEASRRLAGIAGWRLWHPREIANRVDDSVARVMDGAPRVLRRARGYAPAPIALPEDFEGAPPVLAMGGELKATFCLLAEGAAVLSPHQGDLEHPAAYDDYCRNLKLFRRLFDHAPEAVVVDGHPEYLSAKLGRSLGPPILEVQHHHAHVAACLAENGWPQASGPVLGVALDGLGWGADGELWGGEFLIADYRCARRVAALTSVAMPGGTAALREPWRNLFAHIAAALGWSAFGAEFGSLRVTAALSAKPLATIEAMMAGGVNAPAASSCGRLFDAVAAALGAGFERQSHEGEAAARLEALAGRAWDDAPVGYPLALCGPDAQGVRRLDPAPMWRALFEDLARGRPDTSVAARFHRGLAQAVAETARTLAADAGLAAVALSGGCFQNRLLFEEVAQRLRATGLRVLAHAWVPANDGGLSLGQAAVAAARLLGDEERARSCV
jgi:hydrogenase maturation protein HypF